MSDDEAVEESEPVTYPLRVDLPNGWADIRSPRLVTRKARKPIKLSWTRVNDYRDQLRQLSGEDQMPPQRTDEEQMAVAASYSLSPEEIELYDDLNEPLTVALVSEWSYDQPITIEGLNSLPADDAEDLILRCAPLLTDVFIDTTPSRDEDSPT
jgi:hypothetical protein